jgi:hypothetical protein
MSYYGIRPVDRSCGSYGPGHQMHWIQAKKSWEDEQPMIDVSIVVHLDWRVDLEGHELKATMWNHDPGRLRDAVHYRGRGVWKPRFHVLAVPGPSGYLFKMFRGQPGRRHHAPAHRDAPWSASAPAGRARMRCGSLAPTPFALVGGVINTLP